MSAQVMRFRLFGDTPATLHLRRWRRTAWALIFIATTHWPAIVPTVVDCTDCTLAPMVEVWPDLDFTTLNPWLQ